MNIIKVSKVTSSYNGHVAIENINFKIKEGEFVCLVGENGSGKSTILKNITGMHRYEKGSIEINCKKEEISYLEQFNMKDIDFPGTAKEIIMTGLQKPKGRLFYNKEDLKTLESISELLNIDNILKKRIGDLSGGQRQRVLLARTVIGAPKVLILDEPCLGLDIKMIREFYKILYKLNKDKKVTIIIATHDTKELEKTFKDMDMRVIEVAKSIVFDGNIKDWKGL
ncbi:MAG: ATP-binding cassette domain-containing protein [Clostridia bacterium]|nr:ATP-binding cassette domain-containing protein [Clostridia bacterium]MDD4376140.1 ATP-binding cassette domain-containing protein [Clostridia bacterium]